MNSSIEADELSHCLYTEIMFKTENSPKDEHGQQHCQDVLEYTVVIKMIFVKNYKIDFALTSGNNELFI